MIFLIVFEIIDWIRHFDKDGKIKYEFYQTFLYDENCQKTDNEKRELIKEFRQLSYEKMQKGLTKLFAFGGAKNHIDREKAITVISEFLMDFVVVSNKLNSDLF